MKDKVIGALAGVVVAQMPFWQYNSIMQPLLITGFIGVAVWAELKGGKA